ncbi:MAG: hypothetical protein PHR42_01285 [Caldisericia bacterium]|nr:hypothetical protein [Caldisericia bacterium]
MYMFKPRITFRPKITPLQGKELYQFMKETVGMDGNWFFLLGQPEATVLSVYDCYTWHKWMYAWHNENKHYGAVIRARMYPRQQVLLEEASKIKDIRSFIKLILKRENQILSDYKIDSLINIYNRTRGRVYENFDRENNNLSSREDSSINPCIEKKKEIAGQKPEELNPVDRVLVSLKKEEEAQIKKARKRAIDYYKKRAPIHFLAVVGGWSIFTIFLSYIHGEGNMTVRGGILLACLIYGVIYLIYFVKDLKDPLGFNH